MVDGLHLHFYPENKVVYSKRLTFSYTHTHAYTNTLLCSDDGRAAIQSADLHIRSRFVLPIRAFSCVFSWKEKGCSGCLGCGGIFINPPWAESWLSFSKIVQLLIKGWFYYTCSSSSGELMIQTLLVFARLAGMEIIKVIHQGAQKCRLLYQEHQQWIKTLVKLNTLTFPRQQEHPQGR